MPEVQLSAGTIHYRDTGSGAPVVLVHGALVDGRLWDPVVERLDRRCVVPDLPLGSHRIPMRRDADLTPTGLADAIAELLDNPARVHDFDRPVLLAWAPEDRFFPVEHARRLAAVFPDARLVEVPDSYTFVSLDQPERLADLIAE